MLLFFATIAAAAIILPQPYDTLITVIITRITSTQTHLQSTHTHAHMCCYMYMSATALLFLWFWTAQSNFAKLKNLNKVEKKMSLCVYVCVLWVSVSVFGCYSLFFYFIFWFYL